jgi:toxin ParE1/3/4
VNAEFEPEARQELVESIRRYLTEAGAAQASLFESEVARTIALLARLPELGTPGIKNTRSIPLRRYPYSLQYRLEPDLIRVLAVAHHSRRPRYWAKRG